MNPIGIFIGNAIGNRSGTNWVSYWLTRYISALSVVTTSDTEQTVTATIVGTGYDGVSFEYSTDNGTTWTVAGTSANGILNATGLTEATIYIWRARLYKGTNYGAYSDWDAGFTTDIITDADGNVYTTITIGGQTWILQNSTTTKYNDDSAIPTGLSDANWALEDGTAGHDGAFAQVNNNAGNKATYGLLYNWHAVNNAKGIAPNGFRVATNADYTLLVEYLGGATVAGRHMKEGGTVHWTSPNYYSDNTSGFTGLPAGYRAANGTYALLKDYALLWSSTAINATDSYDMQLDVASNLSQQVSQPKTLGMSVRCIDLHERFMDNWIGDIIPSLAAYGEPSVLISDDGEQIDLWFSGTTNIYYSYSTDGAIFSLPTVTDIPNGYLRSGVIKAGSIYYLYANGSSDTTIHVFTSTNKINFTDQGEVIGLGSGADWDLDNLGNTMILKIDDIYYLFYDGIKTTATYWKIGLATSSSPLGPFTKYGSNPIFGYADRDVQGVDMFRINNEVIKHNGLYYAYISYGETTTPGHFDYIERFHSPDLHTWTSDGLTEAMIHKAVGFISYADNVFCQYKGKSYIFMNPSNQVDTAYIDIGIDDRPLIAMLALTP